MTEEPNRVKKRAIAVTPYNHGIWCSIGDGKPFVNEIVHRKWSEDGSRIWFGLDSHNFYDAAPDDMIDVVETTPSYSAEFLAKCMARDAERMAHRPRQPEPCPHCGQLVPVPETPDNPFE